MLYSSINLPIMAAVAVWKKVVSVGYSPPGVGPQSLQEPYLKSPDPLVRSSEVKEIKS